MKESQGYIFYDKIRKKHIARITQQDPATGKRRNFVRTCNTKSEANKALNDLRILVRDPDAIRAQNNKVTIAQLVDQCLEEHYCKVQTIKGRRVKGVRGYATPRTYGREVKKFLGDKLARECDVPTLRKYRDWITDQPVQTGDGVRSLASVNHSIGFLRVVLGFGVEKGILAKNPFTGAKGLFIKHDNARTRIYSFGEELRLLEYASKSKHPLRDLLIIAADTGMRRGEVLSLTPNDIQWSRNRVFLSMENTKTNEARTVQMTDRVGEVMERASQGKKGTELLFTVHEAALWRSWVRALQQTGLPEGRYHDWRRVYLTRCVAAGIPLPIIVKQTGHSSEEWQRYLTADFQEEMLTPLPGQTAEEVEAYAKQVWMGLRKALGFEKINRLLQD